MHYSERSNLYNTAYLKVTSSS